MQKEQQTNKTIPFDPELLKVSISLRNLEEISKDYVSRGEVTGLNRLPWALKAMTLTDLTTLAGDDTAANVRRLCHRAAHPLPQDILDGLVDTELHDGMHTAAVCVYPARVADAYATLKQLGKLEHVSIAAVATGFPTGQYGLPSRLAEIQYAVDSGANEIDIVINRQLALVGDWEGVYREVCEMRKACGNKVHLKTILAIGELGSMENVYKASMACMLAGADFIKTSTGKEAVNATLPVGLAMIYAMQTFKLITGVHVGLKPAGGVRTVDEAITWMSMIRELFGASWLCPQNFRFGASGLLDDIERVVRDSFTGKTTKSKEAAAY